MAGRPVLDGFRHVTDSVLWPLVEAAVTVGAAGFPGGSFTSVTLMVTVMVSEAPDVSVAFTVTV